MVGLIILFEPISDLRVTMVKTLYRARHGEISAKSPLSDC